MDRNTEIGLIKQVIGLADQKSAYLDPTIAHSPITRYISPDRFEREMSAIFKRRPVVLAQSSELTGENAFLTKRFLDLPVLLIRDADGRAQAYFNVCRHRGATLERDAGGCKRVFTCPYHGWSWDNQGDLRAVPHEDQGFPELMRAERALRSLPTAEAFGFIWIIANPETSEMPDIETWIGAELAKDFNWMDLADHRIAQIETVDIAANWKVLIEGGLAAYHFRVAHKHTIAPDFMANLSPYQIYGPHMRGVLPRTTMPDLSQTDETSWEIRRDANLLYTVLPSMQMLVQQDHVMWFHYEPVSIDCTRIRMATLVPNSVPQTDEMEEHWAKNQLITKTALMEDFDLAAEIQSGFASRGNPSHIFGRYEGALNRFNAAVEEMIQG